MLLRVLLVVVLSVIVILGVRALQMRRLLMSRSSLLCAALLLQLVYEVAVCNDAFPLVPLVRSDAVLYRCCVRGL